MIKEEYPYNLKVNIFKNFFDLNPEIKRYPFIQNKISEITEDVVSKKLWCLFLMNDPRSFLFNKLTFSQKVKLIVRNYEQDFNIRGEHESDLMVFYDKYIIVSDDIRFYIKLKKGFEEKSYVDNRFTIAKAVGEFYSLSLYSQKAWSVLNASQVEYKTGVKYPLKVSGKMEEDDFFEKNHELLLFDEMQKLLKEEKKKASKIMWSIYSVHDPQCFYYDKMSKSELESRCNKTFFKIDFYQKQIYVDFYKDVVLTSEESLAYKELNKKYEILITSGGASYTIANATIDRKELLALKDKIENTKSKFSTVVVAGERQPGIIARTILKG